MKKVIKILNNTLTTLRLVASLFMFLFIKMYGYKTTSIIALIIFSTDLIDGLVARCFKVQSFYGCLMDAVSDKVLAIISLIILSQYFTLSLIPLIIEILILITNFLIYKNGYNVQSYMIGKIKTWGIGILIVGGYLSLSIFDDAKNILLVLTLICSSISTLAYYKYLKILILSYKKKIIIKKNKNKLKNINELIFSFFDTNYYLNNKDKPILKLFYKGN